MKPKQGNWFKIVSADRGAIYDGFKWHPFECLICGKASGLLQAKDRLDPGQVSNRAREIAGKGKTRYFKCEGPETHRKYYEKKTRRK